MSIASIADTGQSSSGAAAAAGSQLGRQDFLQLLVMQLKNQDPLNPIDDREFIAQMAQLSSLEATNQLSSQMGQMAAAQQQLGALALVGRDVEYSDGSGGTARGKVVGMKLGAAEPVLKIDDREVPLDQIQTVL